MKNKLRIIGGDWRSRQLNFVDAPGLRPTPARVRETLFNWLQYEIAGKQCLDLYAGSGALGFEAASRGAKLVVQVEINASACKCLKENAIALAADQIKIVPNEVMLYLSGAGHQAFDIAFLDPPFGQQLVIKTCQLLEKNDWLTRNAKIYIETEREFEFFELPENWKQLKSKSAGEVGYHLFERC